MIRWGLVVLALSAAAGCSGDESADGPPAEVAANLDCADPLVWNDVGYRTGIDLPATAELGTGLGPPPHRREPLEVAA
ncbi:MAG TPA: hypothetical protein VD695_08385 [Gaiellaceae bacterium]|nr:hypothetical protein [Gaiellaceae bacterium]